MDGQDATPTDPVRTEMIPEEWRGHRHELYEITIGRRPAYLIFRDDGEYIGAVTGAVSRERMGDMIARHYSPTSDRIPPEGIIVSGTVRILERPNDKKPYHTLYMTIPPATVRRWKLLQDDEVAVEIGDARPTSDYTFYHLSKMGGSMVIVLSKAERRGSRIPEPGEYATIRITAHPGSGRWDLGSVWDKIAVARMTWTSIDRHRLDDEFRPRTPPNRAA